MLRQLNRLAMTQTQPTKTAGTPRRLPSGGDAAMFYAITLLGTGLDLWSKYAVFDRLQNAPTPEYSIIDGFLRFVPVENIGAAFSLFSGMTWMFIVISIVALFVINAFLLFGKLTPRLMVTAAACMHAGVIGNLYDRLFNDGRVRDFIDVYVGSYHWPTFNVADSLLCIGVGLLLIVSFTAPEKNSPPKAAPHF